MRAKRAGGSSDDFGYGIASYSDRASVIAGEFYRTATFGSDKANETTLTSAGRWDIFIAKY